MVTIDAEERKIIITRTAKTKGRAKTTEEQEVIEIREGETLERIFLPGTQYVYECELVLLEVDVINPQTQEKTGEKELKAFAQRKDHAGWLMEFVETEYNI